MSLVRGQDRPPFRRFPRVSGDEPYPEGALVGAWMFSPRERG